MCWGMRRTESLPFPNIASEDEEDLRVFIRTSCIGGRGRFQGFHLKELHREMKRTIGRCYLTEPSRLLPVTGMKKVYSLRARDVEVPATPPGNEETPRRANEEEPAEERGGNLRNANPRPRRTPPPGWTDVPLPGIGWMWISPHLTTYKSSHRKLRIASGTEKDAEPNARIAGSTVANLVVSRGNVITVAVRAGSSLQWRPSLPYTMPLVEETFLELGSGFRSRVTPLEIDVAAVVAADPNILIFFEICGIEGQCFCNVDDGNNIAPEPVIDAPPDLEEESSQQVGNDTSDSTPELEIHAPPDLEEQSFQGTENNAGDTSAQPQLNASSHLNKQSSLGTSNNADKDPSTLSEYFTALDVPKDSAAGTSTQNNSEKNELQGVDTGNDQRTSNQTNAGKKQLQGTGADNEQMTSNKIHAEQNELESHGTSIEQSTSNQTNPEQHELQDRGADTEQRTSKQTNNAEQNKLRINDTQLLQGVANSTSMEPMSVSQNLRNFPSGSALSPIPHLEPRRLFASMKSSLGTPAERSFRKPQMLNVKRNKRLLTKSERDKRLFSGISPHGLSRLSRDGQAGTSGWSNLRGTENPPGMGNPRNQRRKAHRKRKADERAAKLRASQDSEGLVKLGASGVSETSGNSVNSFGQVTNQPSTSREGPANVPPGINRQIIPPGMGNPRNQRLKAYRKWKADQAAAKLRASEVSESSVNSVNSFGQATNQPSTSREGLANVPPGVNRQIIPPGMGNPRNQRLKAHRKRKADERAAKLRASQDSEGLAKLGASGVSETSVNSVNSVGQVTNQPSTSREGPANVPSGINRQIIPPGMGNPRNQRLKAYRKWKADQAAAKLRASEVSEGSAELGASEVSEVSAKLGASEVSGASVNSAVQVTDGPSTSGEGPAHVPSGANAQDIPPGMGKRRNQRKKAYRKRKAAEAAEAAAKLEASEASEASTRQNEEEASAVSEPEEESRDAPK